MKIADDVSDCIGFEWDSGNKNKNLKKHKVSDNECEQVFFNQPFICEFDQVHSDNEPRFYALGKTDSDRRLFLVYTVRNQLIRVISAREMNRNEKKYYDISQGVKE